MEQSRFARFELLAGADGLARLRAASVAVFGLGGVGSYAAEALARSGIGRLTLVDFDLICATNLNRQIHALSETIGRPKAEVMAERCRAINPDAAIEPLQECFSVESGDALLTRNYDFVLDCIDQISAKLLLIQRCKELHLPIVASMGAANKLDPTRIAIGDLFATRNCRLARIMRKELRRRGVMEDVPVVYSTEGFRPLQSGRRETEDDTIGYQQRRAPLGSCSYVPPIFGLTMAGFVIRKLLGED